MVYLAIEMHLFFKLERDTNSWNQIPCVCQHIWPLNMILIIIKFVCFWKDCVSPLFLFLSQVIV